MMKTSITVKTTVRKPVNTVWQLWTTPSHIVKWNYASDDWHTTKAENDLRPGGKFSSRMEAKDGSFGFDFEGIYDIVEPYSKIAYAMSDGRKVSVTFHRSGQSTEIVETFDAESENSPELQQKGWQAILDNFKKYSETL